MEADDVQFRVYIPIKILRAAPITTTTGPSPEKAPGPDCTPSLLLPSVPAAPGCLCSVSPQTFLNEYIAGREPTDKAEILAASQASRAGSSCVLHYAFSMRHH